MPAGLIPTIIRIGTVVGPILLREFRRNPRLRKAVETTADAVAGQVFRKFGAKGKTKRNTFIMKRGRQRFQCRKVK